ncbi:unnamed protein product [Blepharisma stoltei]|uniref:Uncharacterized protein n=1 Tax=Blepharisma stoltei TaxID=1481888 RepID=A0AAU9JAP4_9CILI|nr:unnamed protein product [Blepharisma stoltei]
MVEKIGILCFTLILSVFLTFHGVTGDNIFELEGLQDLRVAANTGGIFYLKDLIQGKNLTYSLSGEIINNTQAELPHLSQGITLAGSVNKNQSIPSANGFELIGQDPMNLGTIFIIEENNLTLWDISDASAPQMITSYQPPFQSSIISVVPYSNGLSSVCAILQATSAGFKAGLINVTNYEEVNYLSEMSVTITSKGSIIGASIYGSDNEIWHAVVLSNSDYQIVIFHYNLTSRSAELFNQINGSAVEEKQFNPISVAFSNSGGYICDQTNGIYQFQSSNFFSAPNQPLLITSLLADPTDFGEIFSCNFQGDVLYVGTASGIVLYGLPEFYYIKKLARYQDPSQPYILSNLPRISLYPPELITGYYVIDANTVTFRISMLDEEMYENLLYDIPVNELFYDDSSNDTTPPYIIAYNVDTDFYYIIFSTPNYVFSYEIDTNPMITLFSSNSGYTFNGTLEVWNSFSQISPNVSIQGVDPRDYTIYTWRGNSAADGFLNPDTIELYTEINITKLNQVFYLPLTNYLSGQDLSYQMYMSNPIDGCEVNIIMPPKSNIISSTQVTTAGYSPVVISDFDDKLRVIVAVPSSTSYAFLYSSTNEGTFLQSTLKCSDPTKTATLATTYNFEDKYILIECSSQSSSTGLFSVDWDIYVLYTDYTVSYLNTISYTQTLFSEKIGFVCDIFYAEKGNQIQLFNMTVGSNAIALNPLQIISSDSLNGITEFTPTDISPDNDFCNLYVYDLVNGLILVYLKDITEKQTLYDYQLFSTFGDRESSVFISYTNGNLFIISSEEADPFSIIVCNIDENELVYEKTLPVMPGCSYTGLSVTEDFLLVFCQNIQQNKVLVFDYHNLYTFESLYTTINLSQVGSISAVKAENNLLFVYSGQYLSTYTVGQVSDYISLYQHSYMLPYFTGISTWALLEFNFTQVPDENVSGDLKLIAKNELYSDSVIITFAFLSRGTVIELNDRFDVENSVLTSGSKVKVIDAQFSTPIPLSAFIGNNIEFGLVYSNGTRIDPTDYCNAAQPICILGKYSMGETLTFNNLTTFAYDMASYGEILYISAPNQILAYNTSESPSKLLQIYNLANINQAYFTSCYKIHTVGGFPQLLIMSCEVFAKSSSTYGNTYLMTLNLTDFSSGFPIPSAYPAYIIETVVDSSQLYPLVFVYNGEDLKIYQLVKQDSQYELNPYFTLDAESLDLNQFYLTSILYTSPTELILIEESAGFLWLKTNNLPPNPVFYDLVSVISFESLIADYGGLHLMSAVLLSDNMTIIATEYQGDAYIFRLGDTDINFVRQVPSINEENAFWMNSLVAIESLQLFAYPYFNYKTDQTFLRVVNYSQPNDNAIYTEIPLGSESPETNIANFLNTKIILGNSEKLGIVEMILMVQTSLDSTTEIVSATLRTFPLVIYNPIGREDSETLELEASIEDSGSKESLGTAKVEFSPKGSTPSKDGSSKSSEWYKKWWVWLAVGLGILLFISAGVFTYIFINKRKTKHRYENMIESASLNS